MKKPLSGDIERNFLGGTVCNRKHNFLRNLDVLADSLEGQHHFSGNRQIAIGIQ